MAATSMLDSLSRKQSVYEPQLVPYYTLAVGSWTSNNTSDQQTRDARHSPLHT